MAKLSDSTEELGIHHLVVLRAEQAGQKEIVGVLSALDIVCAVCSASWIHGKDGGA